MTTWTIRWKLDLQVEFTREEPTHTETSATIISYRFIRQQTLTILNKPSQTRTIDRVMLLTLHQLLTISHKRQVQGNMDTKIKSSTTSSLKTKVSCHHWWIQTSRLLELMLPRELGVLLSQTLWKGAEASRSTHEWVKRIRTMTRPLKV